MTSIPIFRGAATALITPLNADGVDYPALARLIDWQIDEGINALVIAGTTGEGSTLSDEEHRELLSFSAEHIAGRVPFIAGTGSNDTAYSIELTRHACSLGADAVLVVTPYYNKATQKVLIAMYYAIADASSSPLILYYVPSLTGVNIEPTTYLALSEHPRIKAIKEANSNIPKIVETAALVGDRMDIYSGNDDQVVPLMSVGAAGVISVLSNLMPAKTVEMTQRFLRGDVAGSAALQFELTPLIKALFCEVNPIPVKAAMAAMGFCENYVRLPLTTMEEGHFQSMLELMRQQGLVG